MTNLVWDIDQDALAAINEGLQRRESAPEWFTRTDVVLMSRRT